MKKLFIQIMLLMLFIPAMSQPTVYITGTLTDSATNSPIPNHAVYIVSDSSFGFIYFQTVYTNPNGVYMDSVPVPGGSSGTLYIQTYDCNNTLHEATVDFNPASLNFTVNFLICNSNSPCQADFSYYLSGSLTAQFIDYSTGGSGQWSWNFGDGGTSTIQNPSHTYSNPGQYVVTLAYGVPNTTCYDIKSMTVYINDSTGGGCNAAFYVVPDSTNTPPHTFHFIDQSSGNITNWLWNFGDGHSSTLQSPIHTYSQPGAYSVCLTIHGADSSCFDVTCDTLLVGNEPGCQADFTYYPDPSNLTMIQFTDLSAGNITSWTWDFGDGTPVGNQQNPLHHYVAPGSYTVCLTIHGADSNCYDVTCKTVIVGSNTGCQAFFTYYPDSSNTALVQFIDQSAGNIISWSWNFGDPASGPFNFSSLQSPIHQFTVPGTYNVCLTIQGADSLCYDMNCQTVIVGNSAGCMAMFTYSGNPSGGTAIQFIDQSTGNPNTWMWHFGDSTYSTEQNPLHVYPAPGVYIACLTITANNGTNCTSTFCMNVFVNDSVVYHQIYGQVFAGNFPVQLGMAIIASLDTNLNYIQYIDICPIDSNGVYYFTMVPDGNYLVYGIPFEPSGYLPTYFGDVLNWAEATVIALGEPTNPYNIHLIPAGNMPAGPGSISGQLNVGNLKSSMLDKVMMLLMDEAGNAIGFDMVSESGTFDFSTMGYGTYYLHAEMSGITSDYVKVVLTPEKPHADVVMTFSGKSILGINKMHPELEAGILYPNPATDKFSLALNLTEAVTVKVEIINQMGQVASSMNKSLVSGQTVVTLSVSDISSGYYTLRISSDKGINVSRKLLITR